MTFAHPATMGLRAAGLETWLPRRDADAPTLALRRDLIAQKPQAVLALLPAAGSAVLELGHILAARDGFSLPAEPLAVLAELGRRYAEDICILTKAGDGPHILTAGVLCFPNRWHLREKVGKPLLAVHAPVPEYVEKLSSQVDFFLERLRPGRCFQRSNWGIASVATLHLPDTVPPVNPIRDDDFFVRDEAQSFVKLPETGAVIFTIRTTVIPSGDLPPDERAQLLAQVNTISPAWLHYKSIAT